MFIVALEDLNHLQPILKQKPEAVILGLDGFSARSHANVAIEEIPFWADFFHQQGMALFLNAQGILEQDQVEEAKKALAQVAQANVDGIYIADDGWISLADELDSTETLRSLFIMQPETLVCSGQDAKFYLDQGLQAASLSHELALGEIVDILNWIRQNPPTSHVTKESGVELLIAGHYSWMESRRNLVENYLRFIHQAQKFEAGKIYTIQEAMREARLPIWQDEKGTHILSDEPFNVGLDLLTLQQAGLSRYRIDAFLLGNEWAAQKLHAFRQALETKKEELNLGKSTLWNEQTWIKKEGNE